MGILSLFKLDGKKALVTGAGRGLGRDIAIGLAEAGADVAIVDMLEKEAEETAAEIKKIGKDSMAIVSDITSEESVKGTVQKVMDRFGKIDILVNNAGICNWVPAEDMEYDNWKKVFKRSFSLFQIGGERDDKAKIRKYYQCFFNVCLHSQYPSETMPLQYFKSRCCTSYKINGI
jgi:NAD(P)-dependent dehydrogenase (short-subunit alcohol dehydrogenase family)